MLNEEKIKELAGMFEASFHANHIDSFEFWLRNTEIDFVEAEIMDFLKNHDDNGFNENIDTTRIIYLYVMKINGIEIDKSIEDSLYDFYYSEKQAKIISEMYGRTSMIGRKPYTECVKAECFPTSKFDDYVFVKRSKHPLMNTSCIPVPIR